VRPYIDMAVAPADEEALDGIVRVAARLGYGAIGVSHDLIGEVTCRRGILLFPRYTFKASTRREARRALDRAPRNALVVVEAEALDSARYAAVNKRVDVLRIPLKLAGLIDRSTARLFRERGWGLVEVSLHPLLDPGVDTLSSLAAAFRRAEAYSVPLALASDAEDPLDLWPPKAVAALAEVMGIPWERGLSLLTTNPLSILSRRWGVDLLRRCSKLAAQAPG
jgi:RNase P/RNase MRP subunit p30